MAAPFRLPPLPKISSILKIYNVRAQKQLAQNFLFDPRILSRIVSCIGGDISNKHVCEVGPGPGGITREILNRNVESLAVVEKDWRFLQSLKMLASACEGKMRIHHGDILNFDALTVFPREKEVPWTDERQPDLCFVGNLPFNVSLPLLFKWLDSISHRNDAFELGRIPMVLTFQQEVAERLCSMPGDPQRCRLSITAQYLCSVQYCFMIRGGSFVPAPKVDVGVVRIVPRHEFLIQLPFKSVDHVVKHVFHFRQKYCTRGVASLFPPKRDDLVREMFRLSGVNPKARPMSLYVSHFRDLCYAFEEICLRIPSLRGIDTYNRKDWLKHFDETGEPLAELPSPVFEFEPDNSRCLDAG